MHNIGKAVNIGIRVISITHEKVFQCQKCELRTDRDVNAARNVVLEDEHMLTFGCPEKPALRLSVALNLLSVSTRNKKGLVGTLVSRGWHLRTRYSNSTFLY